MKDSSAYGARNVSIVAAGTGEALPGPMACGIVIGAACPITGNPGRGWRAGWASEAAVVPVELQDNTTCGEGRAATSLMCGFDLEVPGECRYG